MIIEITTYNPADGVTPEELMQAERVWPELLRQMQRANQSSFSQNGRWLHGYI